MRVLRIAGVVLCCLCFTDGAHAQSSIPDKPVWTLEFIKVKPGKLGLALGYLDEHWMHVREEAKRQGTVLNYHRISEMVLMVPGVKPGNADSIVLLTEYKNLAAFQDREKVFASIAARLPSTPPGIIPLPNPGELYETMDSSVFQEEPVGVHTPELKLLAKQ